MCVYLRYLHIVAASAVKKISDFCHSQLDLANAYRPVVRSGMFKHECIDLSIFKLRELNICPCTPGDALFLRTSDAAVLKNLCMLHTCDSPYQLHLGSTCLMYFTFFWLCGA
eukprot:6180524-Pleurochrysis_carterae.AAC.3